MLERFIDVLLQFFRSIHEKYQTLLQRLGYSDEPDRPSICMSERISQEENALEIKTNKLDTDRHLLDFGLIATEGSDGRITLRTADDRRQSLDCHLFTKIALDPIITNEEGYPTLVIRCDEGRTIFRSVKKETKFHIEERLFIPDGSVRHYLLWAVDRNDEAPRKKPEGLTVFFENYY